MIQPARKFTGTISSALALALVGACGGVQVADTVPRRLDGEPTQGAFVPPFAYEAYVRGELALARGDAGAAVAQFELATAAPTEDAYLLSRLAYAQALAGDRRSAAATLNHAEKVDGCSEALWLTRAQLAERAGQLVEARDGYARASACAPRSERGVLGLASVLERSGDTAGANEALARFVAAHPEATRSARAALELALRGDDPARVAHAVDAWLASAPPQGEALERAAQWALAHERPELALRIYEHQRTGPRAELECAIHRARGDRDAVRAVLARADAASLGGPAQAADHALFAGAYERAELEATALILAQPSDEAYALRARAHVLAGHRDEALSDLAAIRDVTLRGDIAAEMLAVLGAPALSGELEALRKTPATRAAQ